MAAKRKQSEETVAPLVARPAHTGRRVSFQVGLSPEEVQLLDAARGAVARGAFMRAAAVDAALAVLNGTLDKE